MVESNKSPLPILFLLLSAAVGCAILGLYLWVISADWFLGDDFAFLAHVQRPWSWLQVFLPLEHRFWWAYRPIGMDAYFYLCFKLFGWNASGFFGVTLAAHAITGIVLYRLARQLGFDIPAAVSAALLALSRFPSITNVTLACTFHYTAAVLFHLLSLSLFLDYSRSRRLVFQLGACFCFALALLCNELVLNLPCLLLLASLYLDGFRLSLATITRALRACWPYFALAALFLAFRYLVIAEVERPYLYVLGLDWHVPINSFVHLSILAGSSLSLLVALALMALAGLGLAPARSRRRELWAHIARVWGLCLPWLLAMLLPLSLIPFAMDRFTMPSQIPAALLFCVPLDALWKAHAGRGRISRIALQVALPALLLASLPWYQVRVRAAFSRGPYMRALQQTVARAYPEPRPGTVIKILYGGKCRAEAGVAEQYRGDSFGGAAIYSRYPMKRILVLYEDVTRTPADALLCPKCVYLNLLPSYLVEPVGKRELARELLGLKP
jgi:hypothetical protein